MKKILNIILITLLFSNISPLMTQAADTAVRPPVFGVSPFRVDIDFKPDQKNYEGVIKVSNRDSGDMNMIAYVQDFRPSGGEGQIEYIQDADPEISTSSWFQITPKEFILHNNETKEISYTISLPTDPEPGGHYAAIFIQNKPVQGSGATVSGRIAVNFFITIPGNITLKNTIQEFSQIKQQDGSYQFNILVQNDGNTHTKPSGTLTIADWWNNTVAEIPINPAGNGTGYQLSVLPHSSRYLHTTWTPKEELFGQYTATVNLSYGGPEKLTRTLTIIAFSLRTILMVVFMVIVLLLFIFLFGNRFKKALQAFLKG
jgi:hypothetical protein